MKNNWFVQKKTYSNVNSGNYEFYMLIFGFLECLFHILTKLTKKEIYIILFYKIKDQFLKKEKRLKTDFNKIELLL